MDIYIGFDSAWTDNLKAPGAICAVAVKDGELAQFHPPRLVSFDQAVSFIQKIRSDNGTTLVALDQPTIVPNLTGMRPVERAAASLVSWLGGGAQPANRGKVGMFCDASPIWRFLGALGAMEDPEQARVAVDGLFLMEVFPALAVASLGGRFFGRLAAPKYNPANKRFRMDDWIAVTETAAQESGALGFEELKKWCLQSGRIPKPVKADQDRLDSLICLLIVLHWRLRPREVSLLLGDLATGYMVLPASLAVRQYLTLPARKNSVAMDGTVP